MASLAAVRPGPAHASGPEVCLPCRNARAQRAWQGYRDAQCTFENEGLEGGSAQPFSADLCRTRLAERRIVELEQVIPCNGCVEFKPEYDKAKAGKAFTLPPRAPGRPARR
jgi:hypothetical protein